MSVAYHGGRPPVCQARDLVGRVGAFRAVGGRVTYDEVRRERSRIRLVRYGKADRMVNLTTPIEVIAIDKEL